VVGKLGCVGKKMALLQTSVVYRFMRFANFPNPFLPLLFLLTLQPIFTPKSSTNEKFISNISHIFVSVIDLLGAGRQTSV
jgi:hypothetical protein